MGRFFKYLGTRAFAKNLMIAIFLVIISLVIVFYSLNFYTRHGEGLPVPKLKGLPIEQAIELLESKGFRYKIDSVYIMDKQPGLVVEQDPDANTNVKNNRTIYLTIITRTAPNITLPDIDGKPFLEARAILNNYGLKIGDTTYVSDVARDVITSVTFGGRKITTGQQLPKGSKIDLVLGNGLGASEVDLPNLKDLSLDEVRLVLSGSLLTLGSVKYEKSVSDSLNGKVIKQFPAISDSLKKVSIGTKIDIVISN